VTAAWDWLVNWLPAIPLLVLALALLVAPAVLLVVQSIWREEGGGLTLDNWTRTLGSRNNQVAITTSLQLAVLSATLSTLIGTPAAWLISRMLPVAAQRRCQFRRDRPRLRLLGHHGYGRHGHPEPACPRPELRAA
jgi:ABC-type spermidine/putrescine transport system permease subunit II